jgi:hypothetical protein
LTGGIMIPSQKNAPQPIAYARPAALTAGPTSQSFVALHFPQFWRDRIWPALFGGYGILATYLPRLHHDLHAILVPPTAHLLLKYVLLLAIWLAMTTWLRCSFGTLVSSGVKILAIVAATDGTVAIGAFLGSEGWFAGLFAAVAVCAVAHGRMTELTFQEIGLATAVYCAASAVFSWYFSFGSWIFT